MLASVTRSICLKYINEWLKKRGNGDRTRFNKYLHLRQWLKFHKLEHLTTADKPAYEDPDPVALEDEELETFWKVCPPHKRLMYTVLLCCGLRKAEIQTLRWVDLVGGNEPHVKIQSRPEWNYIPKRHHCRNVPIADQELWAQLMRRKMVQGSKSPLVFHTASGKPLTHLWEDTQRIFRNATLNMEKAHPHCFRATYCTTLLRQGVALPDIMHVMGHKDMASTTRYTAVLSKQKRHERVARRHAATEGN
jgi:integrase